MQKVYLLLRNNQQTGPFSLDELLQFNLKPFDLIWIEGKSAGWYYPQELEAVRPYLPFLQKEKPAIETVQSAVPKTEAAAPKKVFVSMPSGNVAKETVQRETLKPLPIVEEKKTILTNPVGAEPAELKTAYAKSLNEVETDYMNWAYKKKAKKKPVFSKSGIVVLCCLAGALFAVRKIANKPKTEGVNTVSEQTTVATPASSVPEITSTQPGLAPQKTSLLSPVLKKERPAKNALAVKHTETLNQPTRHQTKEIAAANDGGNDDYTPAPVVKEEDKPVAEEKQKAATADAAPKKKLREKIYDLFHKKREESTEETKPTETDNGSRQSTRREAGSSLVQLVAVKFDIPNSWMMGIKAAKATLTNRSSETLSKAMVEVRYYNDDNDLLDKKNIVFSNIKSKQSGTVSVPEHATATRLEYSVISATGSGDAVARL
jgi:hypothetical protein